MKESVRTSALGQPSTLSAAESTACSILAALGISAFGSDMVVTRVCAAAFTVLTLHGNGKKHMPAIPILRASHFSSHSSQTTDIASKRARRDIPPRVTLAKENFSL